MRLWLEKRIDPSLSLQRSLTYAVCRLTIAFVWIYHGLVPKLLFRHADEVAMIMPVSSDPSRAMAMLALVAWGEIGFGLLFLLAWRARMLFLLNVVFMLLALIVVALNFPQYLVAAFNPVTLNTVVMALSIVGFISGNDLPSAKRCKRKKPESET